jgi:hypothetical protein
MYKFPIKPKFVEYHENESFKLHKDLNLFHNKVRIRKPITNMQNLFKDRLGIPLDAPAIRDSYLMKEFSNKYLILLCSELEQEKKLNKIIEKYEKNQLKNNGYEIEITKDFILLKALNLKGFELGINTLTEIFEQTFSKYFEIKDYDQYIQIPSLSILDGI